MIHRAVSPIAAAGVAGGYFSPDEGKVFYDDLAWLILHQYASFNSPVWFNVGVRKKPQCSACFILSVKDNIPSIMDLAVREATIFKGGSGAGSDLSSIRSSKEGITGTSVKASGPLSFGKIYDVGAAVMKSGGTTRRAAKMQVLGVWHPDIMDFVQVKMKEERKAQVLEAAGYSGGMDGEAYSSVFYQNSNFSVRCTDEFMMAAAANREWWTLDKDNNKFEKHNASDILRAIAEAAWQCGDPGVQFDGPIQNMHTCKDTDRIRASNPCGEYLFLDDTACNLASFNLVKFWGIDSDKFEVEKFEHATRVMTTAMDIIMVCEFR
jgi:ribonucleoside-diphosphate reductase alpha chain